MSKLIAATSGAATIIAAALLIVAHLWEIFGALLPILPSGAAIPSFGEGITARTITTFEDIIFAAVLLPWPISRWAWTRCTAARPFPLHLSITSASRERAAMLLFARTARCALAHCGSICRALHATTFACTTRPARRAFYIAQ